MIEGIHFAAAAMSIISMVVCTIRDIKRKQVGLGEMSLFMIANLILACCEAIECKNMILGMVLGVLFLLISIATRERVGKGDAILIMGAGIYLGFIELLVVVFVALLLASGYGFFLLWKKKGWSYEMAFVPFLLFPYTGAVILRFFG